MWTDLFKVSARAVSDQPVFAFVVVLASVIVVLGAWRIVNTGLRLGKRDVSAHASENAFTRFTSYLRY